MEWFVLRDLKRANAKKPNFRMLEEMGFEVFTPLRWSVVKRGAKQTKEQTPVVRDLLFVHSDRESLDGIIEITPTLQYRFKKGGAYRESMTVGEKEMEAFMRVCASTEYPEFLSPEELTPDMMGKDILIVGGPLDGQTGKLITRRGSKKRRLLVSLAGLLSVMVEVEPDYIKIL